MNTMKRSNFHLMCAMTLKSDFCDDEFCSRMKWSSGSSDIQWKICHLTLLSPTVFSRWTCDITRPQGQVGDDLWVWLPVSQNGES
jgi:hypothetical protein